jgi:hypothetical protein
MFANVKHALDVGVVEKNEIMQGRGVGNDDHRRSSFLLRVSRRCRRME